MTRCKKTGKHKFRDELAAKIALAGLQWNDHGERRTYHCPFCGQWHLTSQEKENHGSQDRAD